MSYICLVCVYVLCLIAGNMFRCMSPTASCDSSPGQVFGTIVLTIVALLFGLFTGCLFVDQVNNIISNTTQIDRLKGGPERDNVLDSDIDDRKQLWHNLGEVFGGDPARHGIRWTWFVPVPVTFEDPERLTGYCFRDVPKPRSQAEMEMV